MPLSPMKCRTDLTDRECALIVGGLIGSLSEMADLSAVRRAIKWWAETDQAWVQLVRAKAFASGMFPPECVPGEEPPTRRQG